MLLGGLQLLGRFSVKGFHQQCQLCYCFYERIVRATKSSGRADLTLLFRAAAQEAKHSRAQNLILRILIYRRSSVRPTHDWPIRQKLFTLDVLYFPDKPNPDNCPQGVYGSLVDAVEHVSDMSNNVF
ncbi:unnamed protein product [Brassica oleracea]